MSISSIAKPLQGHCASHPHGELWHPTDLLPQPQGHFGVTLHSATCMPAPCPCSTLPVGSQFPAWYQQPCYSWVPDLSPTDLNIHATGTPAPTPWVPHNYIPAPMPQGPSLTARPQHQCHGVPIPQSDLSVHTLGTPAPSAAFQQSKPWGSHPYGWT